MRVLDSNLNISWQELETKAHSICSSLLQLASGSRDLSQAEKLITFMQAEQIQKMTTLFIQDNFESYFFQFAPFYTRIIPFSVWDKSRDPGANWSKLEHM